MDTAAFVEGLVKLRAAYAAAGLLDQADRAAAARNQGLQRTIQLCEAIARNVLGTVRPGGVPLQISVFGGTQVGKSTMVNVLAQQAIARVYHTAGYTRHAQGFGAEQDCAMVQRNFPRAFPGFGCVAGDRLAPERPQEFSVTATNGFPELGEAALWDAPDCDAVDARDYQEGLIEALTVADAVVYVTSREKYAVNHLLEWLVTLLETGVPVVGVLNMAPVPQQPELLESMKAALEGVRIRMGVGDGPGLQQVLAFEYVTGGDSSSLYSEDSASAAQLRRAAQDAARTGRRDRQARRAAALDYLGRALDEVLAPARSVLQAREEWDRAIAAASKRFVEDYQSGYLDDPNRYDAFKQVGIEILKLLNPPVPGLQKALYTVRTLLSLPARAIIFGSRALWRFAQSQSTGTRGPVVPNEIGTYQEAHARVLNSVSGRLSKLQASSGNEAQPFWRELTHETSQRMDGIQRDFEAKLANHRARTDEWVRETAHGIYAELAKDPVKLNMLRTGRIAADAGAIIVAIHTGGHGNILHDLIVTPAVMSVIEAISQQIAGSYVEARRLELRDRLLADTKVFAEEVYGNTLRDLGARAMSRSGFDKVDATLIEALPQELAKLRREK